jgi:hypothetical protein
LFATTSFDVLHARGAFEQVIYMNKQHKTKRPIRIIKRAQLAQAETRTLVSVSTEPKPKRLTKDSVANFLFGSGGMTAFKRQRGYREADLLRGLAVFSGR